MKILITGARGFVGKNLTAELKNIQHRFDKSHTGITIDEVFEFDINTDPTLLDEWCRQADFVFNLAGVNRPKNNEEFMAGNFGFASTLLNALKKADNKCPVLLSSSIQASLDGRYADSDYGRSKLAGEELFFTYGRETGSKVMVYRFPNLFGKWCRPNYNSVIATFCYNISHDLPIQVNDRSTQLNLLYIDDLVDEMILALEGKGHRCDYNGIEPIASDQGKYYYVPIIYKETLGDIVDLLNEFKEQPNTLIIPEIPDQSFAKKLYSTYLSYLPSEKIKYALTTKKDARGSFTELIKSHTAGQVSVNISKPGVIKGQHWHNTKWEFFIVVSGHALIQERKIDTDEVIEFEVSGEHIQAVYMLPGYTHNIINLSKTENLVTVMWANEIYDPKHPDTFREEVVNGQKNT